MKCFIFLFLIVVSAVFPGCEFVERTWTRLGDKYPFENYYVDRPEVLKISRVLVMPFSNNTDCAGASKEVTDAFILELNKLGCFDVVTIAGAANIAIPEKPAKAGSISRESIRYLCDTYNADALILGEIKNYEPYRPFVLGIKFYTISAESGKTIWHVDETLDSSMKTVSNAARNYYYRQIESDAYTTDVEVMTNSIKMYTQFVCSSMISTLEMTEAKKK